MKNARSKRKPLSYKQKKSLYGYGFISLWLIGTVVFFFRPLVTVVTFTFNKINYLDTGYSLDFTGLETFDYIFRSDPAFIQAITDAVKELAYQVPIILMFSLTIAVVLNQKFIGRAAMRAVFFIPVIVASGVVINIIKGDINAQAVMDGSVSSSMFQVTSMNDLLGKVGLSQGITGTLINTANNIFNLSWKSGVQILLFIAGLQTIPAPLYEAADIEGASGWERFWKITFPMVSPIMILVIIYTIIDTFADYNNKINYLINTRVGNLDIEIGSAMSITYSLAVLLLVGIVYLFINRFIYYSDEQ